MGILRKPLKQNILHIRTFASLCHMHYKPSLQNTNISKPNSLPRPRRNLFTPLCSVSGSSSKYCSTLCSKRPAERGSKRKRWVLSKKKEDQVLRVFISDVAQQPAFIQLLCCSTWFSKAFISFCYV